MLLIREVSACLVFLAGWDIPRIAAGDDRSLSLLTIFAEPLENSALNLRMLRILALRP